jgi:hypothetical protein
MKKNVLKIINERCNCLRYRAAAAAAASAARIALAIPTSRSSAAANVGRCSGSVAQQ